MTRKNWITALACCALLALGACSSSGGEETADSTSPDVSVPAPGSVAAATQSLTDAKAAVADAETALNAAVITESMAVSQADDDSAPEAKVREALKAAEKALDDAVEAANAAVEAAGDDEAAKEPANAAKRAVDEYRAENPLELVTLTVAVWNAEDAVTEARDNVTAEQKTALKTARAALDEAVEEMDDGALKTALSQVADEADELRKSLAWATGADLEPGATSASVMGIVDVGRHPRTKPEGVASDWKRLVIRTVGVPYAKGKFVISPDGDGTTDELPVRAFTTRQFEYVQGEDTDGDTATFDSSSGGLKTSIQLTEDGLVMKTGGDAVYYDMQRKFPAGDEAASVDAWAAIGADGITGKGRGDDLRGGATIATVQHIKDLEALKTAKKYTSSDPMPEVDGTNTLIDDQATALNEAGKDACWTGGVECGNWAHDDLTITFGEPSQASDGSAVWHWRARVPLGPGQDANKITALENRAIMDLGQYDLWLSNYAGFDEGVVLNDRDGKKVKDQGAAADDDHHRYLFHAAYGMFQQLDNINAYGTKRPKYGRSQAFHAGYDAFADATDARTSDLEKQIVGTFEGRTMAHALVTNRPTDNASNQFESLRGDIKLMATIGGAGEGANMIDGTINNLEYLDSGGWNKGYEVSKVVLESSEIAVDGSYKGTAKEEGSEIYTQNGSFSGNFYGPRNNLETAGWWELSKDASDADARHNPKKVRRIIGSYGAVCTKGCSD